MGARPHDVWKPVHGGDLEQARTTSGILVLSSSSIFLFPIRILSPETGRVLRNGVRVLGLVRGGAVGGFAQITCGEP